MRMLKKFELKEGESRVNLPGSSEVTCAANWQDKLGIVVELDSEEMEFVDRAFLVVKCDVEIKMEVALNFIGLVYVVGTDEPLIVFEIL